ncbi:hypothetical protein J1N35_000686 [Gossypium stocksii]|uniref:Uncharacterized protein n=1 Tax=Gossypium stocksii TaxID=47602 RepID=A0A9D3WIU4_9ROSI|nr:hypothetical protein J1N35_000686 [Gossypium stocksii]
MAMDSGADGQSHKAHRSRHSGASAKKKTKAKNKDQNSDQKQQNPEAFAFHSNAKAKRLQSRAVEKEQRRLHLPVIDRSYGKLPPFVVVLQGPPQVGKSLLIKTLVKRYTKHNLPDVQEPITIVSGLDGGNINTEDYSKSIKFSELKNWKEEVHESIRDHFVFGDWSKSVFRNQMSEAKTEEDDMDDDFEDLETGEKYESHRKDDFSNGGS